MNGETVDLLRSTLGRVFAETDGRDALRRLEELGWDEIAADDPETSTRLLFEVQGEALASTPALDLVVLAALGCARDVAVAVHPYPGGAATIAGRLTGGDVEFDGVVFGPVEAGATLAVPVGADGGTAHLVVRAPLAGIRTQALGGMAPELGLVRVCGTLRDVEADLRPASWSRAVADARRALAHQLTAIAAKMVGLAVDYAADRVQFGRPIGAFQAIQHRLADSHVAVEAARTAATQADEVGAELAAAAAKALAGDAVRLAARHCQQVFGAVGFTWDHPFHFAMRRGTVLELLYGSAPEIRRELGGALRAGDQPFSQLVSL